MINTECSAKSPNDALVAIEMAKKFDVELSAIQINLSMLDTRAISNGLLDYCEKMGVGVIARTPLCLVFSRSIDSQSKFSDGDHRLGWPAEQLNLWSFGTKKMLKLAGSKFSSVEENINLALRFAFHIKPYPQ